MALARTRSWACRMRATSPVATASAMARSEEHTSELQSRLHLVCRLLLEKKNKQSFLLFKLDSIPLCFRAMLTHTHSITIDHLAVAGDRPPRLNQATIAITTRTTGLTPFA